ncbi:hypothetical protein VBD025_15225 [Virgibacillus flavescens]|uniref:hypothetical protein n=1 Tax=Virgibacillus flavescens TaxID=1611422 RepID=UPI003D347B8B
MQLSLFGISIALFGIALILVSSGSSPVFGLFVSFSGLLVSLVAYVISEFKKVKSNTL